MNVVRVKPGCQFAVLAPAGIRILGAADVVARRVGVDLEVSCGSEGHAPDDPHTLGEAFDFSVHGFGVDQVLRVRADLMDNLGSAFTVLYECPSTPADLRLATIAYINAGATAPHLHVQRRNRTVYPPIATTPTTTV